MLGDEQLNQLEHLDQLLMNHNLMIHQKSSIHLVFDSKKKNNKFVIRMVCLQMQINPHRATEYTVRSSHQTEFGNIGSCFSMSQ
jgi:hypothetical protein